jgi:hypothetical protein
VGAFLAIQAGREHRQLRAEHRVLKAEVGLVSVGDPTKLHVAAIETGDPLDFAWQVYLPAKFELRWKAQFGGGASSGSHGGGNTDPFYDLLRVRIRETAEGRPQVWFKHRSGSSLMGVSPRDFKLLKNGSVLIEQLGQHETAILDRDQVGTLLLVRELGPDKKPLIEVRFGTPEAFQRERPPQEGP